MFSEKLLQYIWQFQQFDRTNLVTENPAQPLHILKVGQLNTNAGPDFLEAKVQIDEVIWVGNIEIHQSASDWNNHKHDINPDYDSVILHVVWENDIDIFRKNGQKIPVLVLNNKVNQKLLNQYNFLMTNQAIIPCHSQFEKVNSLVKMQMLERVLVTRLERKAKLILEKLDYNKGDWEETTYQLLAKTMGFGLNSIPFERLASIVPLKIIQKHSDQKHAAEALLFGVAGFLEGDLDNYGQNLKKEFNFLKAKYRISDQIGRHEWKFMRLRPANFPTVRLAQFAQIIKNSVSLFSYFLLFEKVESLENIFRTAVSDHFNIENCIGNNENDSMKGIGEASIQNILINTVAPLLVAYSISKTEPQYIDKAINLLEDIKSEKNKITRFWDSLGYSSKNAFDSQGKIELFNEYCSKKACLSCNIGSSLLK